MNREPKISEIEKLVEHFRKTNREDELLEVLREHGITNEEPMEVVEKGTHEFHEEALVLNKIAEHEGLIIREHKPFRKVTDTYRNKPYLRYSVYFVAVFSVIFIILNAPILFSRLSYEEGVSSKIITTESLEQAKMADSAPLDPGEVIPSGSQIIVPKIGVTAPIIFAKSRTESDIQSYLTQGVVHYAGTANPGEVGNVFITGHSSNFWWVKGNYNYVFVNLDKLAVGDQAKIYHNGKKFVYSVKETKVVDPKDVSVLAPSDVPTLTLMTCVPPGTNWRRLVVKLDQISPKYKKPEIVKREVIAGPERLPGTDNSSTGGILLSIWEFIKNILGFSE